MLVWNPPLNLVSTKPGQDRSPRSPREGRGTRRRREKPFTEVTGARGCEGRYPERSRRDGYPGIGRWSLLLPDRFRVVHQDGLSVRILDHIGGVQRRDRRP